MNHRALWGALPMLALMSAVSGCSSDGESEGDSSRTSAFTCEGQFGDWCGRSCTADADCRGEMFCDGGSCDASCATTSDCSAGECISGRCVEMEEDEAPSIGVSDLDIPDEDLMTMEEPEEMVPEICADAEVEFEESIPQVFLLLDQSGSMSWALDGDRNNNPNERWDTLDRVLLGDDADDDDRGIVGDYEDVVGFGALFYTTSEETGSCEVATEAVPVALDNYTRLETAYDSLQPEAATPTAAALTELTATAKASVSTNGPKLLIIATDGKPNTCESNAFDYSGVESAVTSAFDQKLPTYLIFIGEEDPGDPEHTAHLQAVANLGRGKAADESTDPAEYFTAVTEDKLRDAFAEIVGSVRSCVFELNGEVDESQASLGTVELNGDALVYDDPDGWALKSPKEVELLGTACDSIKRGSQMINIEFPCEIFVPSVVK